MEADGTTQTATSLADLFDIDDLKSGSLDSLIDGITTWTEEQKQDKKHEWKNLVQRIHLDHQYRKQDHLHRRFAALAAASLNALNVESAGIQSAYEAEAAKLKCDPGTSLRLTVFKKNVPLLSTSDSSTRTLRAEPAFLLHLWREKTAENERLKLAMEEANAKRMENRTDWLNALITLDKCEACMKELRKPEALVGSVQKSLIQEYQEFIAEQDLVEKELKKLESRIQLLKMARDTQGNNSTIEARRRQLEHDLQTFEEDVEWIRSGKQEELKALQEESKELDRKHAEGLQKFKKILNADKRKIEYLKEALGNTEEKAHSNQV
ncbi:unnamed protein product [Cyprideis torosa]|uniref:Uncharacterized protein n=1 Tax=Cyprideis torosa TaxID=163714 RepID=A0A7R8WAQ3_9CRUS|nr:unnamed protein product [Cyprideis torosa]CAG0888655.1 unnamed protein product [Cyprideis torosa]